MSRWLSAFWLAALLVAVQASAAPADDPISRPQHIVLVSGDEEYRSEEVLPLLARILKRQHGFKCTVLYALDADGTINPGNLKNITGLEALKTADLMVMFIRYRQLPDDQLKLILDYADSGKPMVGFRTTTHAFRYPGGPNAKWNDDFGRLIFGQKWITHHGHHKEKYLTEVDLVFDQKDHPILRGVQPFKCPSWLYHVDGGGDKLHGDCTPLLRGTSLKSSHEKNQKRFPKTQPVAWTKTYTGSAGKTARVFFTTLGHPHDFASESMRKLAINGIYWALGLEREIPPTGCSARLDGPFDLTNAGFGGHKKGIKPGEK